MSAENSGNDCGQFRSLLESELLRPGTNAELTPLSWHEHLLFCEECRSLLAAEEALELLLSSMPAPKLPAHLARRVLLRLQRARSRPGLDRLLEVDAGLEAPAGLSGRVLAALADSRGTEADGLDRLLDRYQVTVDDQLSERILSGLHRERFARPLAFHERKVVRVLMTAAAAAVVYVAAYTLSGGGGAAKTQHSPTELAFADPDLLEEYYLLDNWNLLMPESDVELLVATSIDDADELALGLEEGE